MPGSDLGSRAYPLSQLKEFLGGRVSSDVPASEQSSPIVVRLEGAIAAIDKIAPPDLMQDRIGGKPFETGIAKIVGELLE